VEEIGETAVTEETTPEPLLVMGGGDEGVELETAVPASPDEAAVCPVCGTPLMTGATFCTECGHRMG